VDYGNYKRCKNSSSMKTEPIYDRCWTENRPCYFQYPATCWAMWPDISK
jgi:hypothetical protein